jgi:hypothetical protein
MPAAELAGLDRGIISEFRNIEILLRDSFCKTKNA